MLRLFLLGFISFSILSFSDDVRIDSGTYLYILDKINTDTDKLLYVEEVVDEDSTPRRFWLSFNPQNPVVEIYDNSWFDRFLKPVGDFQKARVARMVRDQFIKIDHNHYSNIKDRKDLYKYYPNNEMVPRSNMKVVQKANDFNQCQPSQKPPMRKNGLPCKDRGQAYKLPTFIWKEISKAFEEDKELKNYYQKGWITPPMIAAAAHLETQFEATLENGEEKELCLKGECTPYKWGKGIGQMGASESLQLWNTHWEAPKTHKNRFVRNFEKISKKLLKNCGGQPYLSKRCIKKFKQHVKNCEKYENLNQGTGHAFCFKPSFKMFAKKMLLAFSQKTTVWQEYVKDKKIHIRPKKIWEIIKESSQNDKSLLFANSARIRAGYINRGAMVNLSLQECVNHPGKLPCNYGNLSNTIGRRPASETSLGTPAKYLGAQILKGEFINRCHVWYFAGLCGPIRKNSLLDQYTRIYQRDVGSLPTLKATAL